jgi:hypothetical protein
VLQGASGTTSPNQALQPTRNKPRAAELSRSAALRAPERRASWPIERRPPQAA